MVIGHASHHLILLLRTPLSVPPRWVNLVFVKVKYKKVKKYIYGEKVTNMVINTLVGQVVDDMADIDKPARLTIKFLWFLFLIVKSEVRKQIGRW